MNHLLVVPIVLPLLAGALLLLLEKAGGRWAQRARPLALASGALLLLCALGLMMQADGGAVQSYLLGNWRAPWGIALALDRSTALLLVLTALLGLAALLDACAGEDRRGAHFHALLQFQLMGVNGAFLTADLFNLFVFFEVLLAASYGLLLHGASRERVQAALHYVVFNLVGSALFLIAISLLYALAGTLNLADLALKLPQLPAQDLALAQAAGLMLAVVFAIKAALLPLYFWLPATYAAAPAAVACLFAILTKVGVYALLRVGTLLFGVGQGSMAGLLEPLPWLGLATLLLAAVGALAADRLRRLVAYLVVASAGTLLVGVGLGSAAALTATLFYLVNSTLVAGAWFLLAERIAWARGGDDRLVPAQLQQGWVGYGLAFFVAAVAVAGVPPLAGFMGKALLLQAAGALPHAGWWVGGVLVSSLMILVALARAGSRLFWEPGERRGMRLPPAAPGQTLALSGLLLAVLGCAVFARPLGRYAEQAAGQLLDRAAYVQAVLGSEPVAPVFDVRKEMRERGDSK
jgi:multicomponent K+:H+ antiporter subunit D